MVTRLVLDQKILGPTPSSPAKFKIIKIESGGIQSPTIDTVQKIAQSLQKSAEESQCRKGTPFQSAMSMLNFYINRAGKNLKPERKQILEQAKTALRKLYGRYYTSQ